MSFFNSSVIFQCDAKFHPDDRYEGVHDVTGEMYCVEDSEQSLADLHVGLARTTTGAKVFTVFKGLLIASLTCLTVRSEISSVSEEGKNYTGKHRFAVKINEGLGHQRKEGTH